MARQSVGEEQEALFQQSPSPPCALYYVQSPSATSNAHSSHPATDSTFHPSPFVNHKASPIAHLSRYSSSRGSNNSFPHHKNAVVNHADDLLYHDSQAHELKANSMKAAHHKRRQRLRVIGLNDEDEDGEDEDNAGVWKYLSLNPSSSCCCIAFQLSWRLVASLCVALLVFFLVTKPPRPKLSFKVGDIRQFSLTEGLDNTGIVTKILTCNCSLDMEIDNYSKVFGLHVHSTTLEMDFGSLKFATSQGDESKVDSQTSMRLVLYVGTKNKPMYGAGRSMEDFLESKQGLPLEIHVTSKSTYHIVGNLISSSYHHYAICQLVVNRSSANRNHISIYKSNCYIHTKKA